MKSNSKIVRQKVQQHIMESVLNNEGQEFTELQECCNYIFSEFERVANYPNNLQRLPNNQDRFSDYLLGLPFNFEFYYTDIRSFINSLELNNNSKREFSDEQVLRMYHSLIYREVLHNKA